MPCGTCCRERPVERASLKPSVESLDAAPVFCNGAEPVASENGTGIRFAAGNGAGALSATSWGTAGGATAPRAVLLRERVASSTVRAPPALIRHTIAAKLILGVQAARTVAGGAPKRARSPTFRMENDFNLRSLTSPKLELGESYSKCGSIWLHLKGVSSAA